MAKALLSNKNYSKLTPLGNKLDEYLKGSMAMVRSGCPHFFSADLAKRGNAVRDLAYNTTSLTYCTHKMMISIVKLPEQARAAAAVDLRAALDAKKFKEPPAIEKKISGWVSGISSA